MCELSYALRTAVGTRPTLPTAQIWLVTKTVHTLKSKEGRTTNFLRPKI